MDLAHLILEEARAQEHLERSRDYFVVRVAYHCFRSDPTQVDGEGFVRFFPVDITHDLEIHPTTTRGRVTLRYRTMRWSFQLTDVDEIRKTIDLWLAQTLRATMRSLKVHELEDQDVTLSVYHGDPSEASTGPPTFEDDLTLFDPVDRFQIAQHEINDPLKQAAGAGAYDQLDELKDWVWTFAKACLRHDFVVWARSTPADNNLYP